MWPGAGSRPYDARPNRTRSKRLLGRRMPAAELARWRTSGRRPAVLGDRERVAERRLLGVVGRVVGLVVAAKWDQMPVTVQWPASSPARAAATSAGQSAGAAPPRLRPVSTLSWTPGVATGRGDLVELVGGVGREVDVGVDRGGVVLARDGQPGQQPAGVAGRAQRQRLVEGRDAEPGRARLAGGPGDLDHAVAVGVGLDDRHRRRRRCSSRSARTLCRIAPRSTTISRARPGVMAADSPITGPAGPRTAAGMDCATWPATIGPPREARVAAAPCSHEPTDAASYGVEAGGEQRTDQPAEHVAGAGGGQPGGAGGGRADPAVGAGDERVPALEQHHAAVASRPRCVA